MEQLLQAITEGRSETKQRFDAQEAQMADVSRSIRALEARTETVEATTKQLQEKTSDIDRRLTELEKRPTSAPTSSFPSTTDSTTMRDPWQQERTVVRITTTAAVPLTAVTEEVHKLVRVAGVSVAHTHRCTDRAWGDRSLCASLHMHRTMQRWSRRCLQPRRPRTDNGGRSLSHRRRAHRFPCTSAAIDPLRRSASDGTCLRRRRRSGSSTHGMTSRWPRGPTRSASVGRSWSEPPSILARERSMRNGAGSPWSRLDWRWKRPSQCTMMLLRLSATLSRVATRRAAE